MNRTPQGPGLRTIVRREYAERQRQEDEARRIRNRDAFRLIASASRNNGNDAA